MRLLGAILAGGAARRFGADKALAEWRGARLIDHVAALLTAHTEALVIAGGTREGLAAVADVPAPGLGPLGGVAGALAYAEREGFDAVLTLPCDTPKLPPGVLETLADAAGAACLADLPVAGRWPAALAQPLAQWLARTDDRSMRAWTRTIGATALPHPPIVNVNRREDLAALC